MKKIVSIVFLFLIIHCSFADEKAIAITIDDLPFVGTTHNKPGNLRRERERFIRMTNALVEHNVPAVGFVIAGAIEKEQWQLLEKFKEQGLTIGNHSYSHMSLNQTSASRYINDVARADEILMPLMDGQKFYRYPYLAEGGGDKKQQVLNYLLTNDYIVAPVTVDSKDYRFNARLLSIYWRHRERHLGRIKTQYLDYIWRQTLRAERLAEKNNLPQKHILLIHANLLNSYVLGDIITMYKDKGYRFITLEEALETPSNNENQLSITQN